MSKILFRVDGNKDLGMGHIIRCLALSVALKKQYPDIEILFFTKYDEGFNAIIEKSFSCKKIEEDGIDEIKKEITSNSVVITDFLNTNNNYIRNLKNKTGSKIICIDNNTKLKHIDCDILINANVLDEKVQLKVGSTRYYLGIKYMILRNDFIENREKKVINDDVKSILVMSGGADDPGFTMRAIRALQNIDNNINIKVVIGPGFAYQKELDDTLSNVNRNFDIIYHPENIVEIMNKVDVAVTAAGIVMWELATLGIPSIEVPLAEHQAYVADVFEKSGAIINMREEKPDEKNLLKTTMMLIYDKQLRKELSENAQRLVDGKGIERVINLIRNEVR